MKYFIILLYACLVLSNTLFGQKYKIVSMAFYNLENLFDTEDDPRTFDNAFTPNGNYHWTQEKLECKIENLAFTIANIGMKEIETPPSIIGISEVENRKVLELLITHPLLRPYDYDIVHEDSPDARGIDVGLLYRRSQFRFMHGQKHFLDLKDEDGSTLFTRDQLCVSGILDEEKFHFIINHWPSRRGGAKKSEHKRLLAAKLTKKIVDSIYQKNSQANIIIMGDFNDNPTDSSFKKVLQTKSKPQVSEGNYIYNPFENKYCKGLGSLGFRDKWYLFDQILVSNHLIDTTRWRYISSSIYKPHFLQNQRGKYKGYPKRSAGNCNGFSDHFPVYMFLGKVVKP